MISPPTKKTFKSDVKTAIFSFWRDTLIDEAKSLTSLRYMRLSFLPLGRGAHPLWWTCYSSPSAVRAATVMGKMLSGRYRSCWLRRHWTQESGACRLPGCGQVPGDVAHLLSGECLALQPYLATTLHHLYDMLDHLLPFLNFVSRILLTCSCFLVLFSKRSWYLGVLFSISSLLHNFGQFNICSCVSSELASLHKGHILDFDLFG